MTISARSNIYEDRYIDIQIDIKIETDLGARYCGSQVCMTISSRSEVWIDHPEVKVRITPK
jgi:hypothetical protein